ncbi:MAG: ribonuclease P [Nanohaloarchaea archaeon]|nr:ribonuclease P [Candidatus Nanohaloarchaea archaeon]
MEQRIAEERIRRLFELAERRFPENTELSNRYIELARKIGMSQNVPLPSELRRRMCSSCNSYLKPGKNCKVRIDSKKQEVNYICANCGEVNRYGY